jgi:hypothetical protein
MGGFDAERFLRSTMRPECRSNRQRTGRFSLMAVLAVRFDEDAIVSRMGIEARLLSDCGSGLTGTKTQRP